MYFITTKNYDNEKRVIGYYTKYEDALEIIKTYADILYEDGYFPYALIKNIPEGVFQYDLNPIWFKWSEKENGYIRCDKPKRWENCIGFGIR